jgi:PAS domain S-box-containing protein
MTSVGQRELLAAILRAGAVIVTNVDGEITAFSEGAELMLAYHADDILGRSARPVLHPDDESEHPAGNRPAALDLKIVLAMRSRAETEVADEVLLTRSGVGVPVRLTTAPLRSADGTPTGLVAIAQDISTEQAATDPGGQRLLLRHHGLHSRRTDRSNLRRVGAGRRRRGARRGDPESRRGPRGTV